MAGTLKPNNTKREANYQYIGGAGNRNSTPAGLFNGVSQNEWDSLNVMYWHATGHYVEIEAFEEFNLWRSGTTGWKAYCSPLKILKYDPETASYDDVTTLYPQTLTEIVENEWEKTLANMQKGKYRFEFNKSYRLDSEWFLEATIITKTLLQSNNKTYSLEPIDTVYETKMNSNTTPSPLVASASSVFSTTYPAWKAFNGTNTSETNCWLTPHNTTTGEIQIDFGAPKKVNRVEITSRNFSTASYSSPKDFEILGSNDGVLYNKIGDFKDINEWTQNETKTFELKKGTYRYLKVKILSNNGISPSDSRNYIGIGGILYKYESLIKELPNSSNENFISYGAVEINGFNAIQYDKNYILQDTVSEDTDGLWKTKISRKPLSITFN